MFFFSDYPCPSWPDSYLHNHTNEGHAFKKDYSISNRCTKQGDILKYRVLVYKTTSNSDSIL
jgi:hypothetical protein